MNFPETNVNASPVFAGMHAIKPNADLNSTTEKMPDCHEKGIAEDLLGRFDIAICPIQFLHRDLQMP